MNSKFSKVAAFIIAGTMIATNFTACNKDSGGGKNKKQETTESDSAANVEQLSETYYKTVELTNLPVELTRIETLYTLSDGFMLYGYDEDYNDVYYTVDKDFAEFNKFELQIPESEDENTEIYGGELTISEDGSILRLCSLTLYDEGFEQPDFKDPDFDWDSIDWDDYNNSYTRGQCIEKYNSDGSFVERIILTDFEGLENTWLSKTIANNGKCYVFGYSYDESEYAKITNGASAKNGYGNSFIIEINPDGSTGELIELPEDSSRIIDVGNIDNATLVVYNTMKNGLSVATIDFEAKKCKVIGEKKWSTGWYQSNPISKGNGEYDAFLTGSNGLDGIKKSTGEVVNILKWLNSDLNPNNVRSCAPYGENEFLVGYTDYVTDKSTIYKLVPRTPEEVQNEKHLSLAVSYLADNIATAVLDYNRAGSGYRIDVVDYDQYNYDNNGEYVEGGVIKQLTGDMLSGKGPDIIDFSSIGMLSAGTLSKGVLTDLYQFLDKDPVVNRQSLVESVLKACEIDGKLFTIPASFSINTYVALSDSEGVKPNWTYDEMFAAAEIAESKGMAFIDDELSGGMNGFQMAMYISMPYLSFENGKAEFNTPEFIKILEFCSKYGPEEDIDTSAPDFDWEAYEAAHSYDWESAQYAVAEKRALVGSMWMSSFRDYQRMMYDKYQGQDLTFVGYPMKNNSGGNMLSFDSSLAITSSCKEKDAAWSFISRNLTEEAQTIDGDSSKYNKLYSFPINKKALETKARVEMEPEYWLNPETGEKETYPTQIWKDDGPIEIPEIDQKGVDIVLSVINSSFSPTIAMSDMDIYTILRDEIKAFLAGDKTAEETAKLLQDRISILLAERN